jgi:hypothetical protein
VTDKLNFIAGAGVMTLTGVKKKLLRQNPVSVQLPPQQISQRLAWI